MEKVAMVDNWVAAQAYARVKPPQWCQRHQFQVGADRFSFSHVRAVQHGALRMGDRDAALQSARLFSLGYGKYFTGYALRSVLAEDFGLANPALLWPLVDLHTMVSGTWAPPWRDRAAFEAMQRRVLQCALLLSDRTAQSRSHAMAYMNSNALLQAAPARMQTRDQALEDLRSALQRQWTLASLPQLVVLFVRVQLHRIHRRTVWDLLPDTPWYRTARAADLAWKDDNPNRCAQTKSLLLQLAVCLAGLKRVLPVERQAFPSTVGHTNWITGWKLPPYTHKHRNYAEFFEHKLCIDEAMLFERDWELALKAENLQRRLTYESQHGNKSSQSEKVRTLKAVPKLNAAALAANRQAPRGLLATVISPAPVLRRPILDLPLMQLMTGKYKRGTYWDQVHEVVLKGPYVDKQTPGAYALNFLNRTRMDQAAQACGVRSPALPFEVVSFPEVEGYFLQFPYLGPVTARIEVKGSKIYEPWPVLTPQTPSVQTLGYDKLTDSQRREALWCLYIRYVFNIGDSHFGNLLVHQERVYSIDMEEHRGTAKTPPAPSLAWMLSPRKFKDTQLWLPHAAHIALLPGDYFDDVTSDEAVRARLFAAQVAAMPSAEQPGMIDTERIL